MQTKITGSDIGGLWPEAKPLWALDATDWALLGMAEETRRRRMSEREDRVREDRVAVWCPLERSDITNIVEGRKISHDARCGHVENGDIVTFYDPDDYAVRVDVRIVAVGVPHMASLACGSGPVTRVVFERA